VERRLVKAVAYSQLMLFSLFTPFLSKKPPEWTDNKKVQPNVFAFVNLNLNLNLRPDERISSYQFSDC
jgi:hypothetical protein